MIFGLLVIDCSGKERPIEFTSPVIVFQVGNPASEEKQKDSKLITLTIHSKYKAAHSSKLASNWLSSYFCIVFTNKRFCKHPMKPQSCLSGCWVIAFGGEKCHFFADTRRFSQAISGRYGQGKQRSISKKRAFSTQRVMAKHALRAIPKQKRLEKALLRYIRRYRSATSVYIHHNSG